MIGFLSMHVLLGSLNLPKDLLGSIIVIGNFDGLHLGHRKLLKKAHHLAKSANSKVMIYTLRPHPMKVLRPELQFKELFPLKNLYFEAEQLGVEAIIIENFDQEFAKISAMDFMQDILIQRLQPSGVVVGSNFRFGKKREGDSMLLQSFLTKNGVLSAIESAFEVEGQPVSSTRIRDAIRSGDMNLANKLLGRPFEIVGEVVHGDGRGRGLGFPTANIDTKNEILPAQGVYATRLIYRGEAFNSVANIGFRPSFESSIEGLVIEAHVLDKNLDLYGKEIQLQFFNKIRSEIKFNSIETLKEQIHQDIVVARGILDKL
jgi:riboflavin kinase/FMN adenylyltransferase